MFFYLQLVRGRNIISHIFDFRLNPFNTSDLNIKSTPVEVATEVCEEIGVKTNPSSPSEPSETSNAWRRRDLVSMVTFR